MRDAEEAYEALAALIGSDDWFFESQKPGILDASVFAYSHLILDVNMAWKDNWLKRTLEKYQNLVNHQERIAEMYF